MNDPNQPQQLQYAPRPRFYQRRWFGWVLRRAVVLIVLALCICWIRGGWESYQYKRAERGVMRYEASANRVAYDDDPATFSQLLANDGYTSDSVSITDVPHAVYDNRSLRRWIEQRFGNSFVVPSVFIHERTSPKGNRRIVLVQISRNGQDALGRFEFTPTANLPSGERPPTTAVAGSSLVMFRRSGDRLRIFEGVPDKEDAARFTIAMDYNGRRIALNGRLSDDDSIELTPSAGNVADFPNLRWWTPPGVDVPTQFEPSYFTDIATTRPTTYPAPSERGLRVVYDEKQAMKIEYDRRFNAASRPATAPTTRPTRGREPA